MGTFQPYLFASRPPARTKLREADGLDRAGAAGNTASPPPRCARRARAVACRLLSVKRAETFGPNCFADGS